LWTWKQVRTTVLLPRAYRSNRADGIVSPRSVVLSCGWIVPRSNPVVLSPYRFGDPASWFIHLAVFERRAQAVLPARESFLGLHPRFRVLPGRPRHRLPVPAALSRFLPLQRNPIVASHHSRSCLLRVMLRPCRSGRLRRLAPASISPVCFNRARSWGSSLQSLTRSGSQPPLGAASPLAIGSAVSLYRTDRPFGGARLPGPSPASVAFRLRHMKRVRRVLLSESRASRIVDGPS